MPVLSEFHADTWLQPGLARKDVLRAHALLAAEMKRRKMEHDPKCELSTEWEEARKELPARVRLAEDGPDEVMVVEDFVALGGSGIERDDAPDLDVIVRADRTEDGYFKVQAEGVEIQLRKVLDPDKEGLVHYVAAPQGPHSDVVPMYHLMLVKCGDLKRRVVEKEMDLEALGDDELLALLGEEEGVEE